MLILDAVEQEAAARREQLAAAEATVARLRDELDKLDAIKTAAEVLTDPAPDTGAAPRTAPATPSPSTKRGAPRRSPVPPANGSSSPQRPAHGRPAPAGGRGATGGDVVTAKQRALLDAIARLGEASTSQVAAAAGRSGDEAAVGKGLKMLRERGLVRHNGLRALAAKWIAADLSAADERVAGRAQAAKTGASRPMAVLTRDVMATLEQDPGLTEGQLAQALDLDREDVAVTCGELLDRGWVQRGPGGEYRKADGETTSDEQGGGTTR